jgi:tetratricopeptide (TPR) repeat protein
MERHLNVKNMIGGLALMFCLAAACLTLLAAPGRAEPVVGAELVLEELFDELREASSYHDAQIITIRIWEVWINNNDSDINLRMMQRGINFMNSGNLTSAEEIFSGIISRDPSFTEAWNKRATVRFMMNDFPGSERDINEVLAREPRHFGAMSGLGLIRMGQGYLEDALVIYKDILVINPNSPEAATLVEELESILRGDPV